MNRAPIHLRKGVWHLRRRVPARFASIDPRPFFTASLHTDSRVEAVAKAEAVWAEAMDAWELRLTGNEPGYETRMRAAKALAQKRGYRYLPAEDVAKLPLMQILARLEDVVDGKGRLDRAKIDAFLGGVPKPTFTVAAALDEFYAVEKGRLLGKSADQLRRHRAPRLKAVRNFIGVIGDKDITTIGTRDLFDFRAWWLDRIETGEVAPNSANKDASYLLAIWRAVARAHDLKLGFSAEGLRLDQEGAGTRPPFSSRFLQDRLIPALWRPDGLNVEARAICLMMINTGARPSEIAGLTGPRIVLDAPVPHITIAPEGRTLKTRNALRSIPLVGASLEAARLCPQGFPRYADNPTLSGTVNKWMAENGLRETPDHTLYSLRHSFESRMIKADFTERMKADLMGHALKRERYGEVPLDHMRDWLLKIAL